MEAFVQLTFLFPDKLTKQKQTNKHKQLTSTLREKIANFLPTYIEYIWI